MSNAVLAGDRSRDRSKATLPTLLRALLGLLLALGIVLGGAGVPALAYDEGTIVSLANQARAANGLGGLVHNGALDSVALGWAQQMAANGSLSHNPNACDQIPGGWTRCGENVAQGYPTGAAVHDGWMNSDGHRANILGDFTDIGVALIEAGGTTWGVQVFAKYPGRGLPPPAAPAPAPAPAPPAAPAPAPAPAPTTAPAEPTPAASPTPTASESPTSAPTPGAASSAPASSDPPQATSPGDAASDPVSSRSGVPWLAWLIPVIAGVLAVVVLLLLPPVRRRLTGRR